METKETKIQEMIDTLTALNQHINGSILSKATGLAYQDVLKSPAARPYIQKKIRRWRNRNSQKPDTRINIIPIKEPIVHEVKPTIQERPEPIEMIFEGIRLSVTRDTEIEDFEGYMKLALRTITRLLKHHQSPES